MVLRRDKWKEDRTNRNHDTVIIAVHKETGQMFGGKKNGTHIGYPKVGHLKSAMNLSDIDPNEYHFVELSFTVNDVTSFTYGKHGTIIGVNDDSAIKPEYTVLKEDV